MAYAVCSAGCLRVERERPRHLEAREFVIATASGKFRKPLYLFESDANAKQHPGSRDVQVCARGATPVKVEIAVTSLQRQCRFDAIAQKTERLVIYLGTDAPA